MKPVIYRELAWDRLADVLREAADAAGAANEVQSALIQFRARFDAAVDAVPAVSGVLDRAPAEPEPIDREEPAAAAVDPINRADEIAAHISETFNKR